MGGRRTPWPKGRCAGWGHALLPARAITGRKLRSGPTCLTLEVSREAVEITWGVGGASARVEADSGAWAQGLTRPVCGVLPRSVSLGSAPRQPWNPRQAVDPRGLGPSHPEGQPLGPSPSTASCIRAAASPPAPWPDLHTGRGLAAERGRGTSPPTVPPHSLACLHEGTHPRWSAQL